MATLSATSLICAQGKLTESPRIVLKFNPLSAILSTFNIQAERPLDKRFSGQVGFQLGAPILTIGAPNLPEPIQYRLIGLTPELRYYISFVKRAVPHGAYLGAYLRLQHVRKQYGIVAYDPDIFQDRAVDVTVKINALGGGFVLGYQFFFKRKIVLDLYVGPKYGAAHSAYSVQCTGCDGDERMAAKPGLGFDGMDLRAGISVGYAF